MQRIALYSQDAHGLGRLRRNVAIARALAAGDTRSVLLISGAGEPAVLKLPAGTDTLALPAVGDGNGGAYGSRCLGIGRDGLVRLRAQALRSAIAAFAPDVLIVDRLASGVEGELAASFEILRELGTQLVLALPEVLGDRDDVTAEWRRTDALAVVRERYDRIWVYGDPLVFDVADEYGLPRDVSRMVRYSGYLDGYASGPASAARERRLREQLRLGDGAVCVCLAGGSDDGCAVAETFARTPLPAGTTGVVLTGPFTQPEQTAALEALAAGRDDLRVVGLLPDADTLIWMADQVVAMGGYHTTSEALAAGKRALLLPSARRPGHLVRARRLRDAGAVDMLCADELTPTALRAWIAAGPRPPAVVASAIDTAGLSRLPLLLDELAVPVEVAPRRRRAKRFGYARRPVAAPQLAAGIAG
jgi:predicted glycosyltransferase